MNQEVVKKIVIGEICLAGKGSVISTVLGSCVSVCIYSRKVGIGGMIHYALPNRSYAQGSGRGNLHFGDLAIRQLVEEMLKRPGVVLADLEAKIIGGAAVLSELVHSRDLGELNIQMARKTLAAHKVPVVGENVSGETGREMFFYPSEGRVRVAKIESPHVLAGMPTPARKIRVLVVDDSKTIQQLLSKVLSCYDIEVIGSALSAEEALPLIPKLRPDVITLDIHMPGLNGVQLLEKYIVNYPIPTIMISSITMSESNHVMSAFELGAVDYIQKPTLAELSTQTELIREKVRVASTVKVRSKGTQKANSSVLISYKKGSAQKNIVAIGSSTGGTEAVKSILLGLPKNIPPIVIVQHIPPVFSAAFAARLNEMCPFEVKEAQDGDMVMPGRVLVAPGGFQMEIFKSGAGLAVRVYEGERVNRHCPSVDVLFNSVADRVGKDAMGIILTGMGEDGAKGLLKMRKAGSFTIAQDEGSCVVYGMPRAAVALNAVVEIHPLSKISSVIIKSLENSQVA